MEIGAHSEEENVILSKKGVGGERREMEREREGEEAEDERGGSVGCGDFEIRIIGA